MPVDSTPTTATEANASTHRRFLSERRDPDGGFMKAARGYVDEMSGFELEWLYRKPFDPRPGNEQFYLQLYAVMNLLRAMEVPGGGRILEVGSGPGWVSELLGLLGFSVDGVEPCADLIAIAEARIEGARRHYRLSERPKVVFHDTSLEEATLEPESFDAVLFHDALHHVIDEESSFTTCFRALKLGGVLGVSEDAWRPGNRMQESALEEEIERYGTHESPFTQQYLDDLLARHGFVDVQRYHAINGLIPADLGETTVGDAAQSRASLNNVLTAYKPAFEGPTSAQPDAETRATIEILDRAFEPSTRKLVLRVRLVNTGETIWLHRPRKAGWISLALRTDPLGGPGAREAQPRHRLPRSVAPRDAVELSLDFFLPEEPDRDRWRLDLVDEGLFWFSQRGTEAPETPLFLSEPPSRRR